IRDQSFCQHLLTDPGESLVVPDAAADPLFSSNLYVVGPPNIRFYAGAPILDEEGYVLGSLSVMDIVPRTITDEQLKIIESIARQASSLLIQRRSILNLTDLAEDRGHLANLLLEAQLAGKQGAWELNLKSGKMYWTRGLYDVLELPPEKGVPSKEQQLAYWTAESAHRLQTYVWEAIGQAGRFDLELQKAHELGDGKWFRSFGEAIADSSGEVTRVVGILADIDQQKRTTLERNHLARMLQEAQEASLQGSWEFDIYTGRIHWTEGLFSILGLPIEKGTPSYLEQLAYYTEESAETLNEAVIEAITKAKPYDLELQRITPEGNERWFRATGKPVISEEGTVARLVGTLMDITERKQISDRLEEAFRQLELAAKTDHLTMLANRGEGERRFRDQVFAGPTSVILLDLDYFKSINDEFGHQAGDFVLKQVAGMLSEVCPGANVARWGGEEFMITMADVNKAEAITRAEEIRRRVQKIKVKQRRITISAGVLSTTEVHDQIEDLIDRVDRALYFCKGLGRNCVRHVDDLTEEQLLNAYDLERVAGANSRPQAA
ncbi:MAG TPA: diguanylate cyclase, partial [Fimbriimonas sp.]|nr:diguanylate cyclase [Fimbriimonas sp.]